MATPDYIVYKLCETARDPRAHRYSASRGIKGLRKAHVAYFPRDGVVGLSKIARLVDMYARRFQTQESMTAQIVEAMETHLKPRGVAVYIEAEHMCMSMRGVRKQGASTVTTRFTGLFRDEPAEQVRFLSMAKA